MCLKQPHRQHEHSADLALPLGPGLQQRAAKDPGPRCRARLWELDDKLHCPLIGTCLPIDELHRLAQRFKFKSPSTNEFGMHVEAVSLSQHRNPVAAAIQHYLEKAHKLWVDRFARLKTDAEVRLHWQECLKRGEVAGPLWATCTHRMVSPETRHQAYGDIHMLSHQVGSSLAADARRLAHLIADNARQGAELRQRAIQHAGELDALRSRLAEAGHAPSLP